MASITDNEPNTTDDAMINAITEGIERRMREEQEAEAAANPQQAKTPKLTLQELLEQETKGNAKMVIGFVNATHERIATTSHIFSSKETDYIMEVLALSEANINRWIGRKELDKVEGERRFMQLEATQDVLYQLDLLLKQRHHFDLVYRRLVERISGTEEEMDKVRSFGEHSCCLHF